MSLNIKNYFLGFLLIITLVLPLASSDKVYAQPLSQNDAGQKASDLLSRMSAEEKVGQVFLITFNGTSVERETKIYDLINRYHIGGVVLQSSNDNFTDSENNLQDIKQLNDSLQQAAWDTSQSPTNPGINYVPLFIGISQEGNLYPNDQILEGVTPLPSLMAIGATWKPELAEQVGKTMGEELSALGFNLYLGPSLDVLDVNMTDGEDMETRSFGGNPYWVGELGKSYIKGLHDGGSNRLAVISKHFPGRGGADRQSDVEVATVRKSEASLNETDLAPFVATTGNDTSAYNSDGFLVSNIRYQGYQGTIHSTTKPISFDQTALEQLLNASPLNDWRTNGGILVSDDLGSQAIKKFYDPTGKSFDARQVARIAFQAGNDLLYMDNFLASGDDDKYITVSRTMDYFIQKYREDSAFAKRVDASALRLLTLKFKLYPDFSVDSITQSNTPLENIGQSTQVSFEVAQNGVTLINPTLNDLKSSLPHSPELGDKLVFFTDNTMYKPCTQCKEQNTIAVDAMQRAVIKLYGPQSGGQVLQYRLSSYAFTDIINYFSGNNPLPGIEDDIRSSNWLVFAMTDVKKDRPASQALKRLLSERQQLLQDKKIIVFAFNAPYYLDATDISKITAYYGLYSKTPSFVEAAVRVLFQELVPMGALPVSVPSIGYDLDTTLSPEADQIIPLSVDLEAYEEQHPEATGTAVSVPPFINTPPFMPTSMLTGTATPTKVPLFKAGDTIPLVTGEIFDHNHNKVPDGTIARFMLSTGGETGVTQQIEATTVDGKARAEYRIQTPGFLEIKVVSGSATLSQILRLDITMDQAVAVTAIAPTIVPTYISPAPATPTPTATTTPASSVQNKSVVPNIGDWLFSVLIVGIVSFMAYEAGKHRISLRWGVRWGFMTAIGGLFGYLLISIIDRGKGWGGDPFQYFGYISMGMIIGWAISWIWQKIE